MIKNIDNTIEHLHDYNILLESREIFLNPKNIDSETDIELAIGFIKNLRLLESINKNPILIHHYNAGGYWAAGFAIYDAIKASECYITMIGYGEIMSAGLLILQAADLRLASKNCQLMMHEGSSGIHEELTHRQAKAWSINEKKKEELLYEILTEKCSKGRIFLDKCSKRSQIKAYLKAQIAKNEDYFLTPEEALELGLIDQIIGSDKYPHINNVSKFQ